MPTTFEAIGTEAFRLRTHEQQLEPFGITKEWVTDFPEVVETADILNSLDDLRIQTTATYQERSSEFDPEARRSRRRLLKNELPDATIQLVKATTQLLFDIDDPVESDYRVHELIGHHLVKTPQTELLVDVIATDVRNLQGVYKQLRTKSFSLGETLRTKLSDSRNTQYETVKLFLASAQEEDFTPLGTLSMMIATDSAEKRNDFLKELDNQLCLGTYDDLIANDLFDFVRNKPLENLNGFRSLGSLWQLMTICNPEVNHEALRDRIVSASAYWPADVRLAFSSAKASFLTKFQNMTNKMAGEITDIGLVIPTTDLQVEFDKAMQQFLVTLQRSSSNQGLFTKLEIIRANVEQQKKRRSGKAAVQAVAEVIAPDPEKEPIIKPLVYVNYDSGETYAKDSEKFSSVINDYLAQHRGLAGLAEDVERILSYMQRLDFSGGPVRGVKKYNSTIKIGSKDYNVFGFKPADAPGLPTTTLVGKKIRVLFTPFENNIAVIVIGDRSKLITVEQKMGIQSGVRPS